MVVMKFGGTSVSTGKNIRTIGEITRREKESTPVIVVSALSGMTDLLLTVLKERDRVQVFEQIKEKHSRLAKDVWGGEYPKEIDMYSDQCLREINQLLQTKQNVKEKSDAIVSYGERMSSFLITQALTSFGITSQQVIATDLIVTNDNFGLAEFLPKPTKKNIQKNLLPLLQNGIVPVVTGYIGSTVDKKITTLGRGGSDYSATIIGYSLNVEEVQIWTDVDGILTTDPRVINDSYLIEKVSYREAAELATFGAKVLHPRTIRPAQQADIPVRVLNTTHPNNKGTLIEVPSVITPRIAAITAKNNITLVNIYSTDMLLQRGFLSKVFSIFAHHNISVDLVSVSEVSVSITLDNDEKLAQALKELTKFATVTDVDTCGIVSIIGERIVGVPKIMKQIFTVLDLNKIEPKMISFGVTDINISLVVASSQVGKAVRCLHKSLLFTN
ncbi:MAG TPA: aspartate kinase [Candidatus Acidoferrales bacterium]|nr:aspartate kinase [Candidatus Acidoferrales bacterium]